ncbi:MAG: helix-turn-helix domain-containing protein [Eubacteriales bacterium]
MDEKLCHDIQNYIDFLEEIGYTVSLTFMSTSSNTAFLPLIQYDFHPIKLCNYLKQNKQTEGRCVQHKTVFRKAEIQKPYYACCYAGVEEFVIPVHCEGELVACIHVSGYRGGVRRSQHFKNRVAKQCDSRFPELYEQLSTEIPSMEKVLSFTRPLAYMLAEFYRLAQENIAQTKVHNYLYLKALKRIYENEGATLTCKELAKQMNYSESYLRYIFKKEGHVSVQAKINQIRLEKAKRMLSISDESVTRIAFLVGFSDSNYFSSYFKKQTGLSPLAYRKKVQEK